MFKKAIRTTFLALGLAMLWLGFFYSYELREQSTAVANNAEQAEDEGQGSQALEFYTLADDRYVEDAEAMSELELNPQHITDFSVTADVQEGNMPDMEYTGLSFTNQDEIAEQPKAIEQEATLMGFPKILAMGGVLFLIFGLASFRIPQK